MSDKKKHPNRIPFESITQLDKWPLPEMADGQRVQASVKKTKPLNQPGERIEDVTEPVSHKPLTAEQLNQITEEAEKEGYAAGFEQGLAEGTRLGQSQGEEQGRKQAYDECRAALEDEQQRFQAMCQALAKPLEDQDTAVENLVVELATRFAQSLLEREITADPAHLYPMVQKAITSLPLGGGNLRVWLHPDDLALAEKTFADRATDWQLRSDPQLARGGCRVESQESLVDFSVERRLREYFEAVALEGPSSVADATAVTDYNKHAEARSADTDEAGSEAADRDTAVPKPDQKTDTDDV